jgi:heparosan-N-sulfate-glucuronate 5-epimerase
MIGRLVLLTPLLVLALAPAARAPHGHYVDFGARPDFVDDRTVTIGLEGVPQVHYAWGVEDNPVTVAHWALQTWSRGERRPMLTAADWLVERQRGDGAWAYLFDFDAVGVPMRAPWISAMAQGMGVSVLVRAYDATHQRHYLRRARRALEPFTRPVARGGVRTRWDGVLWYEEYPGAASQHVLNGFEFALLGLHDLADRSRRARGLWRAGVVGLAAKIATFDAPAVRSQYYAALGLGRQPVGAGYKHEHAILTRTIARLTGRRVLRAYAARWARYERPA